MSKKQITIYTFKRRYMAYKSCSSCYMRCIKRCNAAAFFFLVVSSQHMPSVATHLYSVELLRTDRERCSEDGLPYVHVTMTHAKRLSYKILAVFDDSIVSSRCHRTITRWLNDNTEKVLRSRVAFRAQSDSFLFPSYCLRKMTQFDKIPSR